MVPFGRWFGITSFALMRGLKKDEVKVGYFEAPGLAWRGAKTDQVKAESQDGVLKVSVPETEKKSRQIPIKA